MIDCLNYVFAFIFTVECVLKNVAMGWSQYIADAWNKFDFVIVIGTLIGIILAFQGVEIGPVALIVRMVRMGRMFRLFNSAKTLKKLFNTIIASIPSLLNVCGLLMILMFVFAVLGVQMFATYAETDDINENANFRNLWDALHTLFRFSTGENWNGVMHEMYLNGADKDTCHPTDPDGIKDDGNGYPKRDWDSFDAPYGWCDWGMTNEIERTWGLNGCLPDEDPEAFKTCCRDLNGCADIALLRIYFYLFTIVVTFVMFNLAVGIILDAFDGAGQEETSALSEEHLRIFVEDWSKFDEDATYRIKLSQMRDFFQLLDKPMGFGEEVVATDQQLLKHLLELDLIVRESNISPGEIGDTKFEIFDVATALGRRVMKMEVMKTRETNEPVELEPPDQVNSHLSGISHSPANELIQTYFENTYLRPAPVAAAPVAAETAP
jgi:voltage-dependent calcium channel L type alpha-1D